MRRISILAAAAASCVLIFGARAQDSIAEDRRIADSLAAMLRAGRAVISESQDLINDPSDRPKGLDGQTVLARAVAIYKANTGVDPTGIARDTREGRLLAYEMEAIREVVDSNQDAINAPGTGFKGFIPAVFGRLVSEGFTRRAKGEAEMKVTAPLNLVRNRKSRPDPWEAQTIKDHFLLADWTKGQSYEALIAQGDRTVFRIAVPEYYSPSCLSCHGSPKGELDVTGYPKEGGSAGDLGGVISIKLFHP